MKRQGEQQPLTVFQYSKERATLEIDLASLNQLSSTKTYLDTGHYFHEENKKQCFNVMQDSYKMAPLLICKQKELCNSRDLSNSCNN